MFFDVLTVIASLVSMQAGDKLSILKSWGNDSLVPRPIFPTAAGGLHHRYVESGSGK